MAKYQRPCCILTRVEKKILTKKLCYDPFLGEEKFMDIFQTEISYQGSARGCNKAGITHFKEICEKAPSVIFAEGHQGAFGLGIHLLTDYGAPEDYEMEFENISQFINYTDEILKDMPSEPIYYVDYIYKGNNINPQNILDIAELNNLWGTDMDESLIAITGLKVTKEMVTVYEKRDNTLKITLPNGISLMKFKASYEECKKLQSDGYVELDIIGKCNKNEWCGKVTPQIFIEDYCIVDSAKYFF